MPVIQDLIAQQNYPESLCVVQDTLNSLLKSTWKDSTWSPESTFLFTMSGLFSLEANCEKIQTLLGYYQQVATALGQSERGAALQLQLIGLKHRFNWLEMLSGFNCAEISSTTREKLSKSWRDYILELTGNRLGGLPASESTSSWWLSWLLDSVIFDEPTKSEFQSQIERWLLDFNAPNLGAARNFQALRLLSYDLAVLSGESWNSYPHFQAVVLVPQSMQTKDSQSRQSFLQQLAPDALWQKVMIYWQNHLQLWIPQPETVHRSDYTKPAQWLCAFREISPAGYQNLLAQWRIKHKKRRNLWKKLEQMGLS